MSDSSAFQQLLRLLGRDNEVIRIARGNDSTFAAAPVPFDSLEPAMTALAEARMNVWYEVNPTSYVGTGGRSSAPDITRLAALYADIDFKQKPGGMGSLPEALDLVHDLSSALGVDPAAIVYSGNGIQPYWPIDDGEITDDNRNDVARLLKRWGGLVKQFAKANHGDADSVFDLPRILRVPGSINFKDQQNPKETSVEFFPQAGTVDLQFVRETLDEWDIAEDLVEVSGDIVSPMTSWDWAEHNCAFFDTAMHEISTSTPASRHHWGLKWSSILYGMIRSECVTEEGFYALREALIERFKTLLEQESANKRPYSSREMNGLLKTGQAKAESWSIQKLAEEMRQHTHRFSDSMFQQPGSTLAAAPTSNVSSIFTKQPIVGAPHAPDMNGALALALDTKSQQRLLSASFTDTGNAERLGQWLQGKYIWVPEMGWHEWAGGRYVPDMDNRVQEATKDMLIQMLTTAPTDAARKWAHSSLSKGRMAAALELAKSIPHLVVNPLLLDAKGFEVCTADGIVSLRDGSLRKADPAHDFHTLQTGQAPKAMPTPKWDAFLLRMIEDQERIDYVQRLFGTAIVGKLIHHIFPIFLGIGSNGKSTLFDVMCGVFGQYAAVMPQKFLVQKHGNTHPTEIAQLRGVRLAVNNEIPPTAKFDEDLIKVISGDSRLRGRYMNKDFFTFENTTTNFLLANHLPAVQVGGAGFWRRTRKIDMEIQIPKGEENPYLVSELLEEEGPGILQWVIDGARDMLAHGLRDPNKVIVSTRQYQLEEDTIARFIEDNLQKLPGGQCNREMVFERYKQWCFKQGSQPLQYIKFVREVTQIMPWTNLGTRDVFTDLFMATTTWYDALEGGKE